MARESRRYAIPPEDMDYDWELVRIQTREKELDSMDLSPRPGEIWRSYNRRNKAIIERSMKYGK